MAKREITKVKAGEITVPDYMKDETTQGVVALKQYVTPRRLKIVQKQSSEDLLKNFFVGDVIITPDNDIVCSMGRDDDGRPTESPGFLLTPVYFFVEYCTWNPIELKGRSMAIRGRSIDPNGEIARKAKDPETRYEPHPTEANLKIRHVEHLNFLCLLEGSDDQAVILTFDRGDHRAGRVFCDLVVMRKASIFSGIYKANVNHRENELGDWWGIDMCNPSVEESKPWVDEEKFAKLKEIHEHFANLNKSETLRADYEEVPEPETAF